MGRREGKNHTYIVTFNADVHASGRLALTIAATLLSAASEKSVQSCSFSHSCSAVLATAPSDSSIKEPGGSDLFHKDEAARRFVTELGLGSTSTTETNHCPGEHHPSAKSYLLSPDEEERSRGDELEELAADMTGDTGEELRGDDPAEEDLRAQSTSLYDRRDTSRLNTAAHPFHVDKKAH